VNAGGHDVRAVRTGQPRVADGSDTRPGQPRVAAGSDTGPGERGFAAASDTGTGQPRVAAGSDPESRERSEGTGRRGLLVVVAGPSGVGKGTVHRAVRERIADAVLSVSVTTRPPRPGEIDGVDYRFVDDAGFDALVADDELLEHATYAGHRYGTPRGPVAAAVSAGSVVVLDIEVQGALQVKQAAPDALLVFLLPPSFEELEARLRGRGTEDDGAVARRLRAAREEVARADVFDVQVVNDDLHRCVDEVLDVIEQARRQA
jgi:guanylate kinase